MLELAVLGLLKEKPMSGYELQKQLTAKLGAFWRVSFGSLYPCLKRLAAQGAIEVLDPPEPLTRSRRKHVYRLTEHGELLFHEMLSSADVHDLEQDRFPLRLAFFRYLRPETRLDQLERRRGYLLQRLSDLRASMRSARDRMDAYTLSLLDHGLEEREREIAWLDRLIAAERVASSGGTADDTAAAETARTGPAPGSGTGETPPAPGAAKKRRTARRARRAAGTPRATRRQRTPDPAATDGSDDSRTTTTPEPETGARATSDDDPPASAAGAIAQTRRTNG